VIHGWWRNPCAAEFCNNPSPSTDGETIYRERSVRAVNDEHDYKAIAKLASFVKFQRQRIAFTVPITLLAVVFYLGLPILAGFTKVLTHKAIGDITWAWLYAFAQFIMTWGLCMLYLFKAKSFDKTSADVLDDVKTMEAAAVAA